jgi:type VII secretion-associated serine protease mycosin
MRRLARSAIFFGVLATATLRSFTPAWSYEPPCTQHATQPVPAPSGPPWAQSRFDPARLSTFADGSDVTVAVIDSGVDPAQPSLSGAVQPGADLLDAGGDGRLDCIGHGTAVASIIAARPVHGAPFQGLAPKATIVPLRVTEQLEGTPNGRTGTAAGLATAIHRAVDLHATVLNLSLAYYRDDQSVHDAIRYAEAHDVVVVAAVGNLATQGNPTPYPAAYDGVLGVGATDPTGHRVPTSQSGAYVDVTAPGVGITAAALPTGLTVGDGTSFATPFVAATAALIRQYRPTLTAGQVVNRIKATADPAPADPGSPEYGSGIVNPYRALTEQVSSGDPGTPSSPVPHSRPPHLSAAHGNTRATALGYAGAAIALAAVAVLTAAVWRRGRRRGWRPAANPAHGPPSPEAVERLEEERYRPWNVRR